eukprot:6178603-Pleurochrysis_carterae.AAC.1
MSASFAGSDSTSSCCASAPKPSGCAACSRCAGGCPLCCEASPTRPRARGSSFGLAARPGGAQRPASVLRFFNTILQSIWGISCRWTINIWRTTHIWLVSELHRNVDAA